MTDGDGSVDAGDLLPSTAEILLDNKRLRITSPQIQFSNLARFPPKVLFGDPTKDDDALLSSAQTSDFSGGNGAFHLKEGTDQQRYAFATLYPRYPDQLTKPPFAGTNTAGSADGGAGDKQVLGEFYVAGEFRVVWRVGSKIVTSLIDGSNAEHFLDPFSKYTYTGTLTLGTDLNPGVAWTNGSGDEFFYIPANNGGYYWICDPAGAGGGSINSSSTIKFAYFANWDNKLVGVTTTGRMYFAEDEDPAFPGTGIPKWEQYDLTYRLSKSYRVRGLVNYYDRSDRPTLFIITDRDIWQFDPDGPEIFRIDFGWPSHPRHGMASCVWNGELYISVGMAVYRYEGGTFVPVGLDRDNGLPAPYQGYVARMVGGLNGMYALVQSNNRDPNTDGGRSSIQEWTTFGWHCLWADDNSSLPGTNLTALTMTGIAVTQSDGVSTLVFSTAGSDDNMYTMPLSAENANPRAGIKAGQLFGSSAYYYLDFGEFDADMTAYQKIANSWEIWTEEPVAQDPAMRDDVILQYKIDREPEWRELANYKNCAPGKHVARFGNIVTGTPFNEGEKFFILQRRIVLKRQASYNADKPTVITNQVMDFLKTVDGAKSFTFSVDTSNGTMDGTMNNKELERWLDELLTARRFVPFTIGDRTYRVFLHQEAGIISTGDSTVGRYDVSVIQIPDKQDS